MLTDKLNDAAKKADDNKQDDNSTSKRPAKKEPGFFDNPVVKQVGRTAASVITRSLLGVLGLGGRSRRKSLF